MLRLTNIAHDCQFIHKISHKKQYIIVMAQTDPFLALCPFDRSTNDVLSFNWYKNTGWNVRNGYGVHNCRRSGLVEGFDMINQCYEYEAAHTIQDVLSCNGDLNIALVADSQHSFPSATGWEDKILPPCFPLCGENGVVPWQLNTHSPNTSSLWLWWA